MDILFLLKSLVAILEVVFLCLALFYFLRGIRTKDFQKATCFFCPYLILNLIRIIMGF